MNAADHVFIGRCFEGAAAQWLIGQGYQIIQRNYTISGGEIDIIAQKENTVSFVEVKARKDGDNIRRFGRPSLAVHAEKQRCLIRTAEHYLKEKNVSLHPRLDVLEIYYTRYEDLFCLRFQYYPAAIQKKKSQPTRK
jgi:putative endonuclease